jgi:NAD(P)-dependent dehydrogenase (short-subunit alcohol dehydrogenase family)
MDEFFGKVALITGAGRGMGSEIAMAFCSLGAAVAANDINPLNLDEVVNQIQQSGGTAKAFVFDIAKRMPIEGMIAQVLEQFGHIDILVNHASVEPDVSILDMDEWEFHRTLDVNLAGPFFCMQQVGRVMRAHGGGKIVNLVSSPRMEKAQKGYAAYIASQAGLLGLTRAAAQEFTPYNIQVNAICSGLYNDALFHHQNWDVNQLYPWLEGVPGVRLGIHKDLVGLVLFLCSGAASSLTGQVLSIAAL